MSARFTVGGPMLYEHRVAHATNHTRWVAHAADHSQRHLVAMRAEIEALVETTKQSVGLLRRHL
ncbi:hypothetical protein CHELA20_51347 [Hyphomicrobiales bacterium]|nr:hypothetical protein CHELA41_23666 [Hyphomicrobiales bacterium]CAH1675420.1 hypothetical protein CHELA20_51347 [Hyphomicrobiales bacterium]